jgi:hypothetical protein
MGPPQTSRRTLLALGATGLLAATTPPVGGAVMASAAARPRFPGDPGRQALYYGASLDTEIDIETFEATVGPLGAQRIFRRAEETALLLEQAAQAVANRRFPILSIKPPASWRDVADGLCNTWLDEILDGLAALDTPLCLTVQHEPENDTDGDGNRPITHRKMTEFVLKRAATRAPQVNVMQILMRWTFAPQSGRNPRNWISPEPTLFGIDGYNPWEPGKAKPWLPLRKLLLPVIDVVGTKKPLVIGEYGTRSDPETPGRGANWMKNALNFAVDHNVVAMAYFNVNKKSETRIQLDTERTKAFRRCLRHEATVRPIG